MQQEGFRTLTLSVIDKTIWCFQRSRLPAHLMVRIIVAEKRVHDLGDGCQTGEILNR